MINPIAVKTEDGRIYYLEADAYMRCQREYDLNQNHLETGLFWDFFSEHFQYLLEGNKVFCVDKENSPGLQYLLQQQREWRLVKERKRFEDRAWRDKFNKSQRTTRRNRFRYYA